MAFHGSLWVLWNKRNDLVFNNKLTKEPKVVVVIFKLVALLQNWMVMVSEKDKEKSGRAYQAHGFSDLPLRTRVRCPQ
ncbi:hypothetical protein SORBI_3010G028333 [Sorghum bicolor]|uniref:Uncharacterized protein n=1 Tax=Sorghum bicolor TaxID=4558 RepID=A0A1W0VR83_SORBI|nr:hypothetical protein SORBI_3010G028333 [Sorghum bicolor]